MSGMTGHRIQDWLDSCPSSNEGGVQCVTIPTSLLRQEIARLRGDGEHGHAVAGYVADFEPDDDLPQTFYALRSGATVPAGCTPFYTRPQPVAVAGDAVWVECRQCEGCNHAGINDESATLAACLTCEWSGPSPAEDRCPGCAKEDCMGAACPECGGRYTLMASQEFAALSTQPAPSVSVRGALEILATELRLRCIGEPSAEKGALADLADIAKGALAALSAPSEQVAASVAVPDGKVRLFGRIFDEEVVRTALLGLAADLAAAPVAPEREG